MENAEVISTLNDLIETCKDGEYGFRECAEHVKSESLRSLFTTRAKDCEQASRELQMLVSQLGGEPDTGGSASGALHRGWVAVRATLTGYSDQAMLDECERGEDAAVARYRKALKENLPESVLSVVRRHAEGAQRNHDQIRDLRDRMKASS